MALTMARPYKHPKTGIYWLRKVVPAPLRPIVGQTEMKASLGTRDPETAKVAALDVLSRFNAILSSARAKVLGSNAALNAREIAAAVGVAIREDEARWANDPGTLKHWDDRADFFAAMFEPEDDADGGGGYRAFISDRETRQTAETILRRQGILADPETIRRAAEVWARESLHFATLMRRRCEGDWSATTGLAGRFPAVGAAPTAPEAPEVPLMPLVAAWAAETGKTGKALYDREQTAKAFTKFLGHGDAAKVTADDVVRWKEARLAAGRSTKTVANDFNELSPIWHWAKRNRKLTFTDNPFAGLAPPKVATSAPTRRPYTPEEAWKLLTEARHEVGLLRWLPWLVCFTSARLGEACQAVKEDFIPIKGRPGELAFSIHADGPGRSLKTPQSRRVVPLHPALVAEGFVDYVAGLPAGSPLFPEVGLDKFGTRKGRAGNKHALWVRGDIGIKDTQKDPCHAWRHLFEDRARQAGVPQNVTDALMGHKNAANESEGYGRGFRFMPETTAAYVGLMSNPALLPEAD